MRNTASLQAIKLYLIEKNVAVSAVELVEYFANRFNKTTIYRVLARLEDEGEVHSVIGKDANTYYATCHSTCSKHKHNDNHVHRQCKKCGELSCVEIEVNLPVSNDFIVEETNVLLVGLCVKCK